VHVAFRQKLETPVTLKDLRAFQAENGSPLENMQMLKLTRLSVSRVSKEEWDFLKGVMEKNGEEIPS
jgi:predicted RNA-binding protein with PUA-like domain